MKKGDEIKEDNNLFYFLVNLLILLVMAFVLNEWYATTPHPITLFFLSLTYFALILLPIDQIITHKANISNQKNSSEEDEFQKLKFKIELMETIIHTSIPESQRENMFTKLKELHEERDKTKESDINSLQNFLKSTAQTLETNIRCEIDSVLKINNETTTKLFEDMKEAMKVIVEEVYETYLENHENMIKEIDELREEKEKFRITDVADLKSFVETKLTTLRSDLLKDVVYCWEKEEIADEILDEIREPIEEVKKDLKSLSEKVDEKSKEMFKGMKDLKSLSEEVNENNQEMVKEIQDLKSLSEEVNENNQEMVKEIEDLKSLSEEVDENNQEMVKDLKSLSEKVDKRSQEMFKEIQDLKSLSKKVDEKSQEMFIEIQDLKSLSEEVDESNQEMVKKVKDIVERTFLVAQETFEELESFREDVAEGFEELREESKAKEAAKNVAVKEAAKEAAEQVYQKTEEMVEEKIRQWEEDNDDYLASIPLLYSNRR